MQLFSKLECVHIYQGFPVVPGRNLIPDSLAIKILESADFQEAMSEKSPLTYGKLVIEVPPVREAKPAAEGAKPAAAAGTAKPGAKGAKPANPSRPVIETGVSNMEEAEALVAVRGATVVDQLQLIAANDTRPVVQQAAQDRIAALAAEALKPSKGGAGA